MGKKIFVILFLISVSLGMCVHAFAFTASATMPSPDGVSPVISKVMGKGTATSDWVGQALDLDFGALKVTPWTDNTVNPPKSGIIFLPDHFFAIDIGYTYTGGVGISNITVNCSNFITPNAAQTDGLNVKGVAIFVRKHMSSAGVEQPESFPTDLLLGGKLILGDVTGLSQSITGLGGGWMRIYLGIVTKDPKANPLDPTTAKPFVPGDATGSYSATFTISSS